MLYTNTKTEMTNTLATLADGPKMKTIPNEIFEKLIQNCVLLQDLDMVEFSFEQFSTEIDLQNIEEDITIGQEVEPGIFLEYKITPFQREIIMQIIVIEKEYQDELHSIIYKQEQKQQNDWKSDFYLHSLYL